jgi:hypothetical protein
MKHFDEISNAVIIIIIIFAIIEFVYLQKKPHTEHSDIDILSINPDEPLTKKEMQFLIKHHMSKEGPIDVRTFLNRLISAAVKGFAMGLLLDPDIHSMITYSFVSVTVTAFLYGFEEFI